MMISLIILTSLTVVSLSGVRTSLLADTAAADDDDDGRGEFLMSSST